MAQEGRLIIYEGIYTLIMLMVNPDGYQIAGEGRHLC